MPSGVRGNPITLEVFFVDGDGNAVTPTTPKVSIIDRDGVTVVSLDDPVEDITGHYTYVYTPAVDAPTGAWDSVWIGIIDGAPVGPLHEGFTVLASGTILPGSSNTPYCSGWISTTQLSTGCTTSAVSGLPEETIQSAIDAATEWLYIKSGQMFAGVCTETVRPYGQPTLWYSNLYYAGWAWSTGWWGGMWLGGWNWGCGCGNLSEVNLDYWPIVSIDQVKIDGTVLDPSAYRLDEKRLLVRLPDADGNRLFWPDCQRMDLPDTEADTWSVTLSYGQQATPLAIAAVTELAYELLKPCIGAECSIPTNVRSVNRQGMSYQLVGFEGDMQKVKTGLKAVDMFLNAYNPEGIGRPATVWSPDIEPRARRIGT